MSMSHCYRYAIQILFSSTCKCLSNGKILRHLFSGSEDKFCRLDSIVRSTEYCENYVVKIIENAAHWPHQEMPLEMNRVILKFLVGEIFNSHSKRMRIICSYCILF